MKMQRPANIPISRREALVGDVQALERGVQELELERMHGIELVDRVADEVDRGP